MSAIERWLVGLLLSALVLGGAWVWHLDAVSDAETAGVLKGRAEIQALWNAEKLAANELARVEKAEQVEAAKKAIDEANRKTILAQADADALRAAGSRMQQRIATLAAQARAYQARPPAQGSPPAASPIDLLADLCKGSDEVAGILAEYADAASLAGDTCERVYTGLNPESEHLDIDAKAEP